MSDKKALNRGLDALLGSTQGAQQRTIKEIQIAEISPDQIFDLVTTLLVAYKKRLHERIVEDVRQTSAANYGTEDFKGTLKEEPPKNKKYTEEELWDDPIPF